MLHLQTDKPAKMLDSIMMKCCVLQPSKEMVFLGPELVVFQ